MVAIVTWDKVRILLCPSARCVHKERVGQGTGLEEVLIWEGILLPVLTLGVGTEGGFFNNHIFAIGVEPRGQ